MREYYDLWPKFSEMLSWRGRIKESVRRFIIHKIDEHCLDHRVKKLYAQSGTIKARLSAWGGHASEVLYPPAVEADYRTESYDGHIFAVSRLINHKRIDLLVRAAAVHKIPCRIAGDGPDLETLHSLAKKLGVADRITLLGRISHDQLLDEYATCRAVAFPSFNEDYGLVTLEAFSSAKAVITMNDSGGPTEIVEDGVTGLISEPEIDKFGDALKRLIDDKEEAERFGAAALAVAGQHSWDNAIEKLVEW
jgi:glycosyltransferase involved in cell wall biosynthesis